MVALSPSGFSQVGRQVVGVKTGGTIVVFLVDLTRSYDIMTSACLVLFSYSSDSKTDSVL